MNLSQQQLDAGGLVLCKVKVDAGSVEQIVGRTYRHPALGERAVVRLTSDRLGQAEDLAMEFLGFEAPVVSTPIAQQQRRSLGFAAWALVNDPKQARYALDLVKQMKKAARQARSKPGHAWDTFTAMAKELGKSAPHFLPAFWEEVGRAFKDLGNQTYAGRALNKSMEAERVHALDSDKARRRDVVLEFVLAGCISGSSLSEYGEDLAKQYPPAEAYKVFRDLSVRRTRGGMAPWGAFPKDLARLAKAAGLNADEEIERWLEEAIDAPAMARVPKQLWKACSPHCKRIVARNPSFAIGLLRHTRPEGRYHDAGEVDAWLALLEEWGVFEFLWQEGVRGAPPLGEPIATWFGRIVRVVMPAPARTLEMLKGLAPRLKRENFPLPLSVANRWGHATGVDVDVLETCLSLGIKVEDLPAKSAISFRGWLHAEVDHPLRNQDPVAVSKDERFAVKLATAVDEALRCRGGKPSGRYGESAAQQRPFPQAAADRPAITALWRRHTEGVVASLEDTGLASFQDARARLAATLWPDTLRLFPDLARRLMAVDPIAMLRRTLQAGVFDEYGVPALEKLVEDEKLKVYNVQHGERNIHLTFPSIVVNDKVHAYVVRSDGKVTKHELRLPSKARVEGLIALGDDLAIGYRDDKWQSKMFWTSDTTHVHDAHVYARSAASMATPLADGSFFLGQQAVRPGDKQLESDTYFHDGQRFWRIKAEYDQSLNSQRWSAVEVDPRSGKELRASVPAWLEETDEGAVELGSCELLAAPPGTEGSPLGTRDGLLGWKAVRRRDGTYLGVGIDGRRWEKPLRDAHGAPQAVQGLLRQPGTDRFLPITGASQYVEQIALWDPDGTTRVATLHSYVKEFAHGQAILLPLRFWHLLKVRDEASSKKLRAITRAECEKLYQAAEQDLARTKAESKIAEDMDERLQALGAAVRELLPTAPPRMVSGIAQLVEQARVAGAALVELRDKAAEPPPDRQQAREDTTISDQGARLWNLQPHDINTEDEEDALLGISTSANFLAAAAFFRGEGESGKLPRTRDYWLPMVGDLPLRAWQAYWRVASDKLTGGASASAVGPWLEFLRLWQRAGLAELPGKFAILTGRGPKKLEHRAVGKSFALAQGEDRFVAVNARTPNWNVETRFLRYSTSETPGTPAGYEITSTTELKLGYGSNEIAEFIAAVETAPPPVLSREELAAIAERLSVSPAEVGLVWLGGLRMEAYEANFLPTAVRNAFGWKAAEASAARQALRNFTAELRDKLYAAVVSEGMAAPFAADRSRVLLALENTWRSQTPRRVAIDSELQKRFAAIGSNRWDRNGQGELLGAAADPANHPMLQPRDCEVRASKDRGWPHLKVMVSGQNEAASAGAAVSFAQLIALVHAETPAGYPARAEMPALIQELARLLDHPGLLLPLRTVYVHSDPKKKSLTPTEWLNARVGKTGPKDKDGVAHLDDGLVAAASEDGHHQVLIAFRPAKLKDEDDMQRLRGLLAADAGNADVAEDDGDEPASEGLLPAIDLIRSAGFRKLAAAIQSKNLKPGDWPANPLLSAPDVVRAIQKKHKLEENAAIYYAQVLALPEPTTANVGKWNGWKPAQVKAASAQLIERKLVLEATRARAGRNVFLPGEWLELKAPWLPIESWKLAHLVERGGTLQASCPLGGPMVLRPFDELFAVAWQRILDGDEPRYDEVKRKKK